MSVVQNVADQLLLIAEAGEFVVSGNSAATIDEMKADVLDRLATCENPHQKPIIFDALNSEESSWRGYAHAALKGSPVSSS